MIKINGVISNETEGLTLHDYIKSCDYNSECIVAELNGEIILKEAYAFTNIKDGDVLEILNFVGGG